MTGKKFVSGWPGYSVYNLRSLCSGLDRGHTVGEPGIKLDLSKIIKLCTQAGLSQISDTRWATFIFT